MAEGAGMVVVERLSDARRDGHRVLAVVAGSAVNSDGASNGLTAPNGPSQQRVIRAALAAAGLEPGQVDAVEAHGTGTTLGDPIEAQALIAAYGQGRDEGRPLWLGSVKSNIGHAQAAAGIAGVIKMVMALRHQVLPRTLHAAEPSPHVDWSGGRGPAAHRAGALARWRPAAPGRGVVVRHQRHQRAPHPPRAARRRRGPGRVPGRGRRGWWRAEVGGGAAAGAGAGDGGRWRGAAGGRAGGVAGVGADRGRAGRAGGAAGGMGGGAAGPGSGATWAGRWRLPGRRSSTGRWCSALSGGAGGGAGARWRRGSPRPGVVSGDGARRAVRARWCSCSRGRGASGRGWARSWPRCCPAFAARLAECGRALAPYVDWDLGQVLAGAAGAPGLERADVVQPALWAVMVSLAAAWQAAGVVPDAVAGHSQGEIAAATVAGILTVQDGAKVVALRSRALMALAGAGGMLSVAEPVAAVRDRIAPWGQRLSVAVVNGPSATVVSGDLEALAGLAAGCEAAGVRARAVPVDYASHSAQVEAIREEILGALAQITPGLAQIPMISAMTGQWLDGPEAGAGYWYDSLRAPVDFERAVRALAGAGHRVFIEASPHPVLTAAVTAAAEDVAATATPVVTGSLRRGDGGPARFLASLAEAHVHGRRRGLGGGAGRGAAGGAADVRVPASAVLAGAAAGGGCGRGRGGDVG